MAYTIIKSDGTVLTTIADGTLNTNSTSLGLPGRDYSGYGRYLDSNFVWMLENFANNSPPSNPIRGQLWYNTNDNNLYVCPADGITDPASWVQLQSGQGNTSSTFDNITATGNVVTGNLVAINSVEAQSNIKSTNGYFVSDNGALGYWLKSSGNNVGKLFYNQGAVKVEAIDTTSNVQFAANGTVRFSVFANGLSSVNGVLTVGSTLGVDGQTNISGVTTIGNYNQVAGSSSQLGIRFSGSNVRYGVGFYPNVDNTVIATFFNSSNTIVGTISQTSSNVTWNGLVNGSNIATGTVPMARLNVSQSTTDETQGRLFRTGDWGIGSLAVPSSNLEGNTFNYGRIFRILNTEPTGPGVTGGVISLPVDATPATSYLVAATDGRLFTGHKAGASANVNWYEMLRASSTGNATIGNLAITGNVTINSSSINGNANSTAKVVGAAFQTISGANSFPYDNGMSPVTYADLFTLSTTAVPFSSWIFSFNGQGSNTTELLRFTGSYIVNTSGNVVTITNLTPTSNLLFATTATSTSVTFIGAHENNALMSNRFVYWSAQRLL